MTSFRFRGVDAMHPRLAEAKVGTVLPGNVCGTVSPEAHNLGGRSADSPYTSWTADRDVAKYYAEKKGFGGVILMAPVGAPTPGAQWQWVHSPDVWGEDEVLLQGPRFGLGVSAP